MSLTPHPKLKNIWIARIYPEGRKKDPKTGKPSNKRDQYLYEGDEAGARSWYASLLRSPKTSNIVPLAPTLTQAWPAFCLYYENHTAESTYNDYLKTWGLHLEKWWGNHRPHQITPPLVETYKQTRLKQKSKRGATPAKKTINKELSYISAMVTWMALPENNMAHQLPFAIRGFPAKQVKPPLARVPTRTEMIRFLRKAEHKYRGIFATCYYAGLRKSEALKLTGNDINLQQGYLIIKGKGSKQRIVPIHIKLRAYLCKKKRHGYLWINPETDKPYTDLRHPIERAAEKAGISQHVYLHLLRHSFGTHAIQSGVNLRSVQILMGHSSSQTTEVYTTLAATFLTDEINKIGRNPLRIAPNNNAKT